MTSHAAGRGATLALGAALVTFALGLVWSAWLADDAFITFRCMDNFVHGRGLVWNVDERVQAFTNPLWLFLLAGPYALTGSLYPIAIGAGVLVTAVAVALVVRSASSRWTAAVCVLALAGSKAFLEYSTSGLENPLLHVAVLLAAGAYLAPIDQERRAVGVAAATTLAFLTRPDALLFTGILCVAVWLERPTLRALGRMALTWLPAFAWEAFSVAYFGTFVPNTAIAKLSGELPRAEMIDQGLLYLANSLRWDPLTLTTVAVALLTFAPRPGRWRRRESLVMIAVALHLAYVVSVGGDFMSGRFLTTSFAVSVFLLARLRVDPRVLGAAAAMAVVLGVATERSPWRPRPGPMAFLEALDPAGITDERAIYYAFTGLVSEGHPTWGRMVDGDPYPPAEYARAQLAEGERVQIHGQVGMLGHFAGPGVHVLDVMGLGDPLLARMPLRSAEGEWLFASKLNRFGRYWRIGHLRRPAPPGYRESLAADENLVRDDALARYYGAIRALTRDPMWSRSRWRTLWDFQRGRYDDDLDAWRRAHAEAVERRAAGD